MCVIEDPPLEVAGLCVVSEVSMWCKRVDRAWAEDECMCVARLVANVFW